jgi:hypothetical protein
MRNDVQIYCTHKCMSRVQYGGVQVRDRTHGNCVLESKFKPKIIIF